MSKNLKNIPGFTQLKVWHHIYWYIIDCSPGSGDPFKHSIGGWFNTYGEACNFAQANYIGHYL